MNIQIQTVHFDADSKLLDHVNKRIEKLKTFHDNILDIEVYLKLDNVVHQVKDKVAEIKVLVPKHTFFVKHESKVFEESFDTAFDALINQIKKRKEKVLV
jgi:putative sigma-54 modulation protein